MTVLGPGGPTDPGLTLDAMQVLSHGIPLTLLLDLIEPMGPDSELILVSEQTHAA